MRQQRNPVPEWLSPVFIACCAALLFIETCIVGGIRVNYPMLIVIFTGSLLAYSLSKLRIHLHFGTDEKTLVTGAPGYLRMAIASVICLLPLIIFLNRWQVFWLAIIAVSSFLYMIPVSLPTGRISGLRSLFLIKNVLLAIVWTIATVIIPAEIIPADFINSPVFWISILRFLFIYCLATLYDLPDTDSDRLAGTITIPVLLGKRNTMILASITLLGFILFSVRDLGLDNGIMVALLISAVPVAAILVYGNPEKHAEGYKLVVDSTMAFQAILVMVMAG
jgi:4-hydroxybenzoate polyprenyltransferase